MIRKIFSIFGIVAMLAFFMPWIKACDKVESGFGLFITGSLNNFDVSSVSSLNSGILFFFVPLFAVLAAWFIKNSADGTLEIPKWFGFAFAALSFLSLWNIGVWGGMEISMVRDEWQTALHSHAMTMAKLAGINILGAILLIAFIVNRWRRQKFNPDWSTFVLIFPLFGCVGMGFTIRPLYYGIWVYTLSLAALVVGAVWDGIYISRKKKI